MGAKVTKTVRSAKEYKEVVKAAKVLDLDVSRLKAGGSWEDDNGELCWPNVINPEKVGHTYFHEEMLVGENEQDVVKIKPVKSSGVSGSGYLEIHLE